MIKNGNLQNNLNKSFSTVSLEKIDSKLIRETIIKTEISTLCRILIMANIIINPSNKFTFYYNIQYATRSIAVLVGSIIENSRSTDRKSILARLMALINSHRGPRIIIEDRLIPCHIIETIIEIGIESWRIDAIFDGGRFSIYDYLKISVILHIFLFDFVDQFIFSLANIFLKRVNIYLNKYNLPRTLTLNLHLALLPFASCAMYTTMRVPIFTFHGKTMCGFVHKIGDSFALSVTSGTVQFTYA